MVREFSRARSEFNQPAPAEINPALADLATDASKI
jgi:hypothetical protein